jgi:DNA-binding MarR family transcriptional regulator
MTTNSPHVPSQDLIQSLGYGFWSSKCLLSAVELDVFTALSRGPLALEDLRNAIQIHPRGAAAFLDALVALGLLRRSQAEPRLCGLNLAASEE